MIVKKDNKVSIFHVWYEGKGGYPWIVVFSWSQR